MELKEKRWTIILSPLLALTFGLLVGAIFLIFTGKNPFQVYLLIFQGSLGSKYFISETLIKATPLILAGLGLAIGFKGGLFNIGAEGQLLVGALIAALVGFKVTHLPSFLHIILALGAAGLGGALWAALAGWLKAKRGVHEVISTIMLNYIAIYITNYLVREPFKSGYLPKTPLILSTAKLPLLLPDTRLSIGIILALGLAYLMYRLLEQTVFGYELKAVGFNPQAAEYAGINQVRMIILTMGLSGTLAGLAGGVEILGLHHRFYGQFSPGYGFDSIAVALLGKNNPLGVVFAALLFAVMRTGAMYMQRIAQVSTDIVLILQAAIIFFIAIEFAFKPWTSRRRSV